MRCKTLLCALALVLLLAVGCAGPNPMVGTTGSDGIAGFWSGLWHGMIAPFTFVTSLFKHSVSFYEVHNNGGWYNFGFVLGVGILFGGSGASSRRS